MNTKRSKAVEAQEKTLKKYKKLENIRSVNY